MAGEDRKGPYVKAKRTFLGLPHRGPDPRGPFAPASDADASHVEKAAPADGDSPGGSTRRPGDEDDVDEAWAMPASNAVAVSAPKAGARQWPKDTTKDYDKRLDASQPPAVDNSSIVAAPIMELGGDKRAMIPSAPDFQDEGSEIDLDPDPSESAQPKDPERPSASPIAKLFADALPDKPAADSAPDSSEGEPSSSLLKDLGAVAPPDEWPGVGGDEVANAETVVEAQRARSVPKTTRADDEGVSRGWLFGAALAVGVGIGIAYFATRGAPAEPTASSSAAVSSETATEPAKSTGAPTPTESAPATTAPSAAPRPSASAPAPTTPSASAATKPKPRTGPVRPRPNLPDIYEP